MDSTTAHRTWRTLEPIHGMIYFVAEAREQYQLAGVNDARSGYFASRSAALGEAYAELVIATFYNFNPDIVRAAMDGVWNVTSPAALLEARLVAADRALRRLLGDDVIDSDDMVEAAGLARQAAESATAHLEGRPLFAGHAKLPWPTAPHLVLWHAQSLLREFRGDAHIAALVADGVSGIDALLMHAGSGAIPAEVLRRSRAWEPDVWNAAADRLRHAGVLNPDGSLTDTGAARRTWVEDRTDALSVAAYEAIGDDGCARLRELCRPMSRAIVDSGGLVAAN